MKLWLAIMVMSGLAAAPVAAASMFGQSVDAAAEPKSRQAVKFRLIEDSVGDPRPVHHSGMIAHTRMGPNAVLGIGLFKTAPKKLGSGEWRTEGRGPTSRKAAVRFVFSF